MAKGAGRKPAVKEAGPLQDDGMKAAISPEEAERAAASFVPLWRLDEAPFETAGPMSDADLQALASPSAVLLAPPPSITSALSAEGLDVSVGSTDVELRARATVKVTRPALHQPIPERPQDAALPSVIVEGSGDGSGVQPTSDASHKAEALRPTIAAPAVQVTPDPFVSGSRTVEVEPKADKTDPAIGRSRLASALPGRAMPDDGGGAYAVPRSRTPTIAVAALVLVGSLGGVLYITNKPDPVQVAQPVSSTLHAMSPQALEPDPAARIPPPPAVELPPPTPVESLPTAPAAPAASAPSVAPTPPVQVSQPRPPSPPTTSVLTVARSTSNPSAGAGLAVRPSAAPRSTPTKPSTPSTPSGAIVRDNPF